MGKAFCWATSQGSLAATSAIVASLRIMSVATPLGWIVLTRIDCGASCSRPTLHEGHQGALGRGVGLRSRRDRCPSALIPCVELVRTMDPPRPPSMSAGIAASTVFHAPTRFTSTMSRNVCSRSSSSVTRMMPAFAMTMSRRPNSRTPSATTPSHGFAVANIDLPHQDSATHGPRPVARFGQVVGGRAGIVGGLEVRADVDGDDVGALARRASPRARGPSRGRRR